MSPIQPNFSGSIVIPPVTPQSTTNAQAPVEAPPQVDANEITQDSEVSIQDSPEHQDRPRSVGFPDLAAGKGLPPERVSVSNAGRILGQSYADQALQNNDEIGIVSEMSQEERLEAARSMVQTDGLNNTLADENRCGAACLTMAAFYQGGEEGLTTLIEGIRDFNQNLLPGKAQKDTRVLNEIERRLDAGEALSYNDISHIQEQLYQLLDTFEQEDRGNLEAGLSNRVLNRFLDETPGMADLFDSNQIGLRAIDNVGDGYSNHFVLMFEDQSWVYDPYPLRDGNQVIQDPERVSSYVQAIDPRSGPARN